MQIVYDLKYEGYVNRQEQQVARQKRLAEKRIPETFDFTAIHHLRTEAREKLTRVRPVTLAQAIEFSLAAHQHQKSAFPSTRSHRSASR